MQNYSIHIYTTDKNIDRCEYILQTWGKHVDNLFFYTDKPKEDKRYIFCTKKDDYSSHIDKNFYAFKYALDNLQNIDWHLFIGDDTFVYNYNLELLTKKLNKDDNSIFGEILHPGVGVDNLAYIGGGGGLLLNTTSLIDLISNDFITNAGKYKINYSDVITGIICVIGKIKLKHIQGFHTHPPETYGIKNPEDHITFHYINKKEQFYNLYEKYKEK